MIDGSALSLLVANHLLLPYPEQTVLTPHQMEWQRLSSLPIQEQRIKKTKEATGNRCCARFEKS